MGTTRNGGEKMTVKCAKCGFSQEGYTRDDGAVMVLNPDGFGDYQNSWIHGCHNCSTCSGGAVGFTPKNL